MLVRPVPRRSSLVRNSHNRCASLRVGWAAHIGQPLPLDGRLGDKGGHNPLRQCAVGAQTFLQHMMRHFCHGGRRQAADAMVKLLVKIGM